EGKIQQSELRPAEERNAQLGVEYGETAAKHAVEYRARALLALTRETFVLADRAEAVSSDECFLTEVERRNSSAFRIFSVAAVTQPADGERRWTHEEVS